MKQVIKGYEVESDGFRQATRFLGEIGKFEVSNSKKRCVFAFAISILDKAKKRLNDADLYKQALGAIENYIENGKITDGKEYTFQFEEVFSAVKNPNWWVKSN